jgi:Mg2+ and Co2+ transporter CorA
VIFIPFQVISALFGMNVQVPLQHNDEGSLPFFLIILVCMMISATLLLTLRYLNMI